jgi:flagellar assembly factor FliW
MITETKDLGLVEIDEKNIISFPHGLYGFEDAVRFVILKDNDSENPFMWLQCVDNKQICFIVVEPSSFINGYDPKISLQLKETIKFTADEALRFATICTIPTDFNKTTINLKCPVIINSIDNIAMQVILEDDRYSMTYPLLNEVEG